MNYYQIVLTITIILTLLSPPIAFLFFSIYYILKYTKLTAKFYEYVNTKLFKLHVVKFSEDIVVGYMNVLLNNKLHKVSCCKKDGELTLVVKEIGLNKYTFKSKNVIEKKRFNKELLINEVKRINACY